MKSIIPKNQEWNDFKRHPQNVVLLVSCLTLGRKVFSPCISPILDKRKKKLVCTIWNMDHIFRHLNFYFTKVEFFPQKGHNGCQKNPHIKFVYHSLNKPFNLQLVWLHATSAEGAEQSTSTVTPCAQPRGKFLHHVSPTHGISAFWVWPRECEPEWRWELKWGEDDPLYWALIMCQVLC